MTQATHPVAAEELMAMLDGELTANESRAIDAHLAECAECARLVEEFRGVSKALGGWTIADAAPAMGEAVSKAAAEAAQNMTGGKISRRWSWQGWAMSGGGLLAGAAVVLVVAGVIFFPGMSAHKERQMAFESPSQLAPTANGQAVADKKTEMAIPEKRAMNGLVAISPGVVAESYDAPPPAPAPSVAKERRAMGSIAGGGGAPRVDNFAQAAPMIATTVSLSIVVRDLPAARAALDATLARHQGYSAQLTVNTEQNVQRTLQDSLRVPAGQLAAVLAELKGLGRVESETQSGDEVTQQHADLAARLQNSRETEQRMRDILAQRTGRIEDVLEVEEEIARVRGEIERMEAEQATLEHRVDFATVDLRIAEEYKEQFGMPSASAGTQLRNAFVAGMRNGAGTLLGIVLFFEENGPVLLIWLAILAAPGFLLWRRYRRLRAQS